ncbi:MAG: thioredoxin family protein [Cyclobacteriaceae bacterium]
MRTIKLLGIRSPQSRQIESIIHEAVRHLGVNAEVIKVEDPLKFRSYNAPETPAIVIDEILKICGEIPSVDKVMDALT